MIVYGIVVIMASLQVRKAALRASHHSGQSGSSVGESHARST